MMATGHSSESSTGQQHTYKHSTSRSSLSRSLSLQMLLNTPKQTPVQQEMYTEQLRPLKSPPKYFGVPVYSGPLPDPLDDDDEMEDEQRSRLGTPENPSLTDVLAPPILRETGSTESPAYSLEGSITGRRSSPSSSKTKQRPVSHSYIASDQNVRKFTGDAAWAHTFASDSRRHNRIVSLPARPRSEFDFDFNSTLPTDFAKSIGIVAAERAPSSTYSAESVREQYISGSRHGSPAIPLAGYGSGYRTPTPGGSRSMTPQGMRSTSSLSNTESRSAPKLKRKSSMFATLNQWIGDRTETREESRTSSSSSPGS